MLGRPDQMQKLVDFFKAGRKLSYKKGDIIIRPEDPPGGIFFIDEGFVKAYAITKYGEENLLIIRKSGEVFPLLWAFTDTHRDIFYSAMDASILWRQSRDDYLKFLEKNPDVLPVVVDMAIAMYYIHAERVNNLEYRTVRERVISFMIFLSKRFGLETPAGIHIAVPIRRHEIAASINATRETTSREITSLTRKGLLGEVNGQLLLPNIEKLRSLL
jgi:CRP/FNR family transcriptional regulator